MAQPIGLVEQFLFSHWRGRGSIKPENIVTDFGSGGAICQKKLEGQGPIWLGVVVLFLVGTAKCQHKFLIQDDISRKLPS